MGIADSLSDPKKMIVYIIVLVVAIQILVQLLPDLIVAIINISQISNMPFAAFFEANGVVLLALGAAVVLGVIAVFGVLKASKR